MLSGLAALAAALSLAGRRRAAARELTVDRGVVQSVSPTQIVLRELDGSTVALALGARTRVLVNGFPATLADIEPGFVAAVAHTTARHRPELIRAFGRILPTIDRGVVVSASAAGLRRSHAGGDEVTFRVTARTRIRCRGLPATHRGDTAGARRRGHPHPGR